MAILELNDLNVRYGNIHAVKNLKLYIDAKELVCLIGANGAGKSSTLKAIVGIEASQGQINFDGQPIDSMATHLRVARGIALVPEGRGVFAKMTVLENLYMGAYLAQVDPLVLQQVFDYFPRLKERQQQLAGTLSGGEQQMLAIGRALLSKPKLLLLDEPSMGLAPILIEQIFEVIRHLKQQGLPMLLVEQNAKAALKLADRAYVLEHGEQTLTGNAKDLLSDSRIQAAYLGG